MNIDDFLDTIAQVESGGGQNFAHKTLTTGMHKGHAAIGTYGIMPNTVDDVINNMKSTPELDRVFNMEPKEKKAYLETHPETEYKIAKELAEEVLAKHNGDAEKAAYAWNHGHNLSSKSIENADYKNSDYVQKFNKYDESEFPKKIDTRQLKLTPLSKSLAQVSTPLEISNPDIKSMMEDYYAGRTANLQDELNPANSDPFQDIAPALTTPLSYQDVEQPSTKRAKNIFNQIKRAVKVPSINEPMIFNPSIPDEEDLEKQGMGMPHKRGF